jgi:hypothetical protein
MKLTKSGGTSAAKRNGHRAQTTQNEALNGAEKSGETSLTENPFEPPIFSNNSLHGLIGEVVEIIGPHTEAHPAALLFQLLAAIGNMLGRGAATLGGNSTHRANLFVAIVGRSSKARKGTSWSACEPFLRCVDPEWLEGNVIHQALSTGQGLVHAVRDPVNGEDPGVPDKRKLVIDEELANVIVAQSKGNLSATLRKAWDGGTMGALTRTRPLIATDPHISIVGHITASELRDLLVGTREMKNGWSNRFLWILVDRAHSLPFGADTGNLKFKKLAGQIRKALEEAKRLPLLEWDPKDGVRDRWQVIYGRLMNVGDGPVAAATDRAEAQILRIAFLFAVLDQSPTIKLPHLEAGLACWEFASQSASKLFGGSKALSPRARKLLDALQDGPEGLTVAEINRLFSNHLKQHEMEELVKELTDRQLASVRSEPGKGRTGTRVTAVFQTSEASVAQ